jgi:hypothetical protein
MIYVILRLQRPKIAGNGRLALKMQPGPERALFYRTSATEWSFAQHISVLI